MSSITFNQIIICIFALACLIFAIKVVKVVWIKETFTDSGVSSKRITTFTFVALAVALHITYIYIALIRIEAISRLRSELNILEVYELTMRYILYFFIADALFILLMFAIITSQDLTKWLTLFRGGKIEDKKDPE